MISRLRHLLSWRAHQLLAEMFYNHVLAGIPFNALRVAYLRYVGAQVGPHTHLSSGGEVVSPRNLVFKGHTHVGRFTSFTALGPITIGRNVSIASRVVFMTADHDINAPDFPGRSAPIVVEDRAWIATGAMILKGVTVGEGAVVGAGAVIHKDVPAWTVWVGNPARQIGTRSPDQSYEFDFGGLRP